MPRKLAPDKTDMFAEKLNKVIPSCVLKDIKTVYQLVRKTVHILEVKLAECKHKSCGLNKPKP